MRRNNDIGGMPIEAAIDTHAEPWAPWHHRVDAMRRVLGDSTRQLVSLDELRRAMEDLPPELYTGLGFFDRRVLAIEAILIEKGVLTRAEIETEVERDASNGTVTDA